MARLIYIGITSLDGYTADDHGNFDWAMPDEEVHAFVNDLERPVGIHLYGRKMYEVMIGWQTMPLDGEPDVVVDFARIWRAAEKVVYSTTLREASTPQTRIDTDFDAEAIRQLKATATSDISIGGSTLAAHAVSAGLVDDFHLLVNPVIVGGGIRYLPDDVRLDLDLVSERRFGNGVVHLHYAAR
jgi:dihydrofolate reductase